MAGARKHQPSSIDRLGADIVEWVGRRRAEGRTTDQIHEELNALPELQEADIRISRSAIGRHLKSIAAVGERMRRSREITESLARICDRAAGNKMLRGTIELVNSILLDVALAEEEGDDGEFRAVEFNPAKVKALAQTVESLARAEKMDADREAKIRRDAEEAATKAAAGRVRDGAKRRGLGPETVDWIYKEALGVSS
ncbi:hypothetical protein BH09PSE4_BH09PSE4_17190 [soil metagenome]